MLERMEREALPTLLKSLDAPEPGIRAAVTGLLGKRRYWTEDITRAVRRGQLRRALRS